MQIVLSWREALPTSYDSRLLKCYDPGGGGGVGGRLQSGTQLVKSHGDDLDLKFLWNWDEYGSLEHSLKAMEKNAEYGGQPEI